MRFFVTGLIGLTVLLFPQAAYAIDKQPIIDALNASQVYVSPKAITAGKNAAVQLATKLYPNDHIAVAIVTRDAAKTDAQRKQFYKDVYAGLDKPGILVIAFETSKRHWVLFGWSPQRYVPDKLRQQYQHEADRGASTSTQALTQFIIKAHKYEQDHGLEPGKEVRPFFGLDRSLKSVQIFEYIAAGLYVIAVLTGLTKVMDVVGQRKRMEALRHKKRKAAEDKPANDRLDWIRNPPPAKTTYDPVGWPPKATIPEPTPAKAVKPKRIFDEATLHRAQARSRAVWSNVPNANIKPLEAGDPRKVVGLETYRITGRIGEGGMGRVYLAEVESSEPSNRRQVAVKMMLPDQVRLESFHRRFLREIDMAGKLGEVSSYFVLIHDSNLSPDNPWIVTEFADGLDLYHLVRERQRKLTVTEGRDLMVSLTEALLVAHNSSIIHRDIKPANIIITREGPKICDFGIAKPIKGPNITQTDVVIATRGYASPEHLSAGEVGPKSDIFSLGATMIFAMTGQNPFVTNDDNRMFYQMERGSSHLKDVPAELRPIVAKCLKFDAADRISAMDIIFQLTS